MPKNLDTFRKVYSNSVQGFHFLNDEEKAQEATGQTVAHVGRIVKNSFQGPVPAGERVDHKQQREYQGLMMKAQTVVKMLDQVPQ